VATCGCGKLKAVTLLYYGFPNTLFICYLSIYLCVERYACCAVQKPHGYHLDVFVLSLLIMVCSVLGLPWFVAATVRSVTHVRSLLKESEVKIPGEKTQIVGARYATHLTHRVRPNITRNQYLTHPNLFNPLTPTVATWLYSYRASCARPG